MDRDFMEIQGGQFVMQGSRLVKQVKKVGTVGKVLQVRLVRKVRKA